MHDLASYVMRGPRQAAILATLAAAIPMLYWVAVATIALVVLRFGLWRGVAVAAWPMLPALLWMLVAGDPSVVLSLLAALLMAEVLRISVSWPVVFLVGGLFFWLVAWATPLLMPEFNALMQELSALLLKSMQDAGTLAVQAEPETLQAAFEAFVMSCFVGGLLGMSIMGLFLARAWQARLYNPGGWRQEFHRLRLRPTHLLVLSVLILLMAALGAELSRLLMLAALPLIVLGLAMMHGLVAKRSLGPNWLFVLYALIVLLIPASILLLVVLAMLDALIDFRGSVPAEQNGK
jgi:hypothetical protein